jgi:hypothetical protein
MFNILFEILTQGQFGPKNTNGNNSILDTCNIHIVPLLYRITGTLNMARELPKHVAAINK